MAVKNLKSKKLRECEGEDLYINLENLDVFCNFPYPDDGVTFRTKILEIVLDGDVISDEALNDEDIEDILSKVQTVIVTESEKKRKSRRGKLKSFQEFLSESEKKGQKSMTVSEILKTATRKVTNS